MVKEPLNLSVQNTNPLWCHFVISFLSSAWCLLLCLYSPLCASANCFRVNCRRPRPLSFSQFQMCQINSQSSRAYRRIHYCHCRNAPTVPISALLIYIRVKYYSSVWHLFRSLPLMVPADPEEHCIARTLLFYSSGDSGVLSYVSFDQLWLRFFEQNGCGGLKVETFGTYCMSSAQTLVSHFETCLRCL